MRRRFAAKVKPPLSRIATIDEATIAQIAALVPSGGITLDQVKADTEIVDALNKRHSSGVDNQDLSGFVSKETGKSLINDSLIEYIHEPGSDNQDLSLLEAHRLSAHAPSNAQPNNISDVNAGLLTGGQQTTLHTHPASGSDPWTVIKLGADFTTSLVANTNVTNFFFTPQANKTYLIFGYFLLRTATATVGARPGVAWPSGLVDSIIRIEAANSLTTSALQLFGARTTKNAASTGLATTADSHWGSLDGVMITAANVAGNFQITLASETAGTNVTMKAGSLIMYREL